MMNKILRTLALGLALALGMTQVGSAQSTVASHVLFGNYDVTTAGYTYGFFGNAAGLPNANPFGPGIEVTMANKRVKTTGASTTIDGVDAAGNAFDGIAIGDLLIFPRSVTSPSSPLTRYVLTKPNADQITVADTAINLDLAAGYPFRYKNFISGTAAGDGWFDCGQYAAINIDFQVTTINATSLDATLEARSFQEGATANPLAVKNFTAAGHQAVAVDMRTVKYDQCRVGWRVNTDTGAQDVYTFINLVPQGNAQ